MMIGGRGAMYKPIAYFGEINAVAAETKRRFGGSSVRSKMLRLAYHNGKLIRLPMLHRPNDGAPREGSSSALSTRPTATLNRAGEMCDSLITGG